MKTFFPIVPRIRKVCFGFLKTLVCSKHLDLIILHRKLAHIPERLFLIVVSEKMDADDVESIAELQISRVLCVMRVHKPAVILDLDAGDTARFNKVIAVIGCWFIHVGKESVQSLRDREIDSIEETDHTVFLKRILYGAGFRRIGTAFP